jgi:8-oxo-dGTP diphosphatase
VLAVTGFVTAVDGRILLVHVAERGWEMPGGRVEEGEDLVTALRREIAEETGCTVDVAELVGVYSRVSAPTMVLHLFRCRHIAGEPLPQDDDIREAGWFTADEAHVLVSQPVAAARLADALSEPTGIVYRAYRHDPYDVLAERIV